MSAYTLGNRVIDGNVLLAYVLRLETQALTPNGKPPVPVLNL